MKEIIFVVVACVGFVGCCGVLANSADYMMCRSVERNTGRPTSYSFVSGCYVNVDGRQTPLSAWRVQ